MKEFKISFEIFDENYKKVFSFDKISLNKGVVAINGFATKKIGIKKKKSHNIF